MVNLLHMLLSRTIRNGTLSVLYPDGNRATYGSGAPATAIRIADWAAANRLAVSPSLGFGEAWMDGRLTIDDGTLFDLVDVLITNAPRFGLGTVVRLRNRARHLIRHVSQRNPTGRARRNVAHHYDLDGRLYALFLDADRQYSCAYFPRGDETLEEAQTAKKRHIAAKLLLDRPGLDVLDIGSGWGGMALTLARDYGCRVTGITLSVEQLHESRRRAEEAGLAARVRFELVDYRTLAEKGRRFDRVVSVGMFEHVGIGHFDEFFGAIKRVLRPDGTALVHAIGRADGPAVTNDWIDRYIFPGGYSPALSETVAAVERQRLWITDCEILRLHYAKTIHHWRARFAANRDRIRALYDERFCRMFELYLVGSEIAFAREDHMNFQLQLSPSREAVPLTRDYMLDRERDAAKALDAETRNQQQAA